MNAKGGNEKEEGGISQSFRNHVHPPSQSNQVQHSTEQPRPEHPSPPRNRSQTLYSNMSQDLTHGQSIRIRKPRANPEVPRVPPKPDEALLSLSQRRGMRPLPPPKQWKPLPPAPKLKHINSAEYKALQSKPLPRPPNSLDIKTTLLWVAGFCLWFLLIVVLLPVIMERDAMPSFNRWLRGWWR